MHTLKPLHISPLPPPPLTPTTHPIHTHLTQQLLPFPNLYQNTLHPLTHRHYILETFHHISLTILHLSPFPEQIIFSSTHHPKFITLSHPFSTPSSIMPQNKNPHIPQLITPKLPPT
ncbi:lyase family protein, partial [Staphylococcus epidermidis]|uniref:lyase family protein n=1 Tax=Staphylococcus epidermidis TaxID=1282 RepID=UPI0037D9C004